jgi:hypothetical protein
VLLLLLLLLQAKGSFQVLHGTATAATPTVDAKAGISAVLCNTAKSERAAAVVVASASRGGIREALLGSVAANLVHHCDVPVVVLHKPKVVQQQQQQGGQVAWLLSATAEDMAGRAGSDQQQSEEAVSGCCGWLAAGLVAVHQHASQQLCVRLVAFVVAVDDNAEAGSWAAR